MRYHSQGDNTLLTRASLGPVLSVRRRRQAMPIPGRGTGSFAARSSFGALTSPIPVGAGAGPGAAIGAQQGASIGSAIVPGIGTAVGALVGAIGGAIAGSLDKKDPEESNFSQAVALWQQNPDNIYAIGNKYLPLAGLFDLKLNGPHIPIYLQYGRMGEEHFVNDLCRVIYNAAQAGQINNNDTPLTVMAKVVQPWIDSFGKGAMNDPHGDMINRLIIGMIMDYVLGRVNSWRAVGGDLPASFNSIPPFSLPVTSQPQVTAAPTPSPVATQPAPAPTPISLPVAPSPSTGGNALTQISTALNPPVAQVQNPATVPSTPPALGAPITAANDAGSGFMIGVPPGATYGGLANTSWIVVYSSGPNAGEYIIRNGALIPYTPPGATVASLPVPATPPAVSTTPPTLGTPISVIRDNTTGNMINVPAGGIFNGIAPNGGWIIAYGTSSGQPPGAYTSNNGVLTPYSIGTTGVSTVNTQPTSSTTIPSGFTLTSQTAVLGGQTFPLYLDSLGNAYVWTGTQMVPYSNAVNNPAAAAVTTSVSSGGGGGGYYMPDTSGASSTPVTPIAPVTSTGIDSSTLLLIAGLGALLLLGGRK